MRSAFLLEHGSCLSDMETPRKRIAQKHYRNMRSSTRQEIWPRWLRKKNAAKYSAIGQKRLIQLAKDGVIVGFPDPDHGNHHWIFDRYSLDAYRKAQAADSAEIRLKAIDIVRSVKP